MELFDEVHSKHSDIFGPLETIIQTRLLPNLTGQPSFNDTEHKLFALPARLGGLGLVDPSQYSIFQFSASVAITVPLVQSILQQSSAPPADVLCDQLEAKRHVVEKHRKSITDSYNSLLPLLFSSLHRSVLLSGESGSSSWLTALPLSEHGFALHKGAFRDALCLRYGWQPPLLPSSCVCGKRFTIEHALGCPCGGFPSMGHNELRDITAELLTEVCHNVGVEPTLQPLTGEQLFYRSANVEDGARLDVVAEGFWDHRQKAYFDVKVFNPLAPTYSSISLPQCYRRAELKKRRMYEERIREIEHGSFTPLVFSCSGGMGPLATIVYKRLASLISEKSSQSYSLTLYW